MNNIPLWATIAIAILGSGTVGGIAGAISSSFAAQQKLKELEVAYNQKLEEYYRSAISSQIQTLYLPINSAVSILLNEYNKYMWSKHLNQEQAVTEFRLVCENFVKQMLEIYDQGKDAYLI